MKVSKELFKSYVDVQMAGNYNMVMQAREVMDIIGCTAEEYRYILSHYSELAKEYSE